jgi:hypothetical protein
MEKETFAKKAYGMCMSIEKNVNISSVLPYKVFFAILFLGTYLG